jgi:hypothetical protein
MMHGSDPYADPHSIVHLLDFSPGHAIRAKVRELFSTPVNPVSSNSCFHLVVSFGRSVFRLSPINASLALLACLGGAYDSLGVTHLYGRVFRFSVISKAVGFLIQRKFSYECDHLWGAGGPNWVREESAWIKESDREWNFVSRKRSSPIKKGPKFQWRRINSQTMDLSLSSNRHKSLSTSGSPLSNTICSFVEESGSIGNSADIDRRSSSHDHRKFICEVNPNSNRPLSDHILAAQRDSPTRSPLIAPVMNSYSQGNSLQRQMLNYEGFNYGTFQCFKCLAPGHLYY